MEKELSWNSWRRRSRIRFYENNEAWNGAWCEALSEWCSCQRCLRNIFPASWDFWEIFVKNWQEKSLEAIRWFRCLKRQEKGMPQERKTMRSDDGEVIECPFEKKVKGRFFTGEEGEGKVGREIRKKRVRKIGWSHPPLLSLTRFAMGERRRRVLDNPVFQSIHIYWLNWSRKKWQCVHDKKEIGRV